MKEVVIVLDNIRSLHNVGSITRTASGFGVKQIITCGITPYPEIQDDPRLPHVRQKASRQIHKTALGAELVIQFEHFDSAEKAILHLKEQGYNILAIEQSAEAQPISKLKYKPPVALILGPEVEGLSESVLNQCNEIHEIPMTGPKESFNVSVAAGIALYQLSIN